jgi:hypothetical protein
MPTDSLRVIVVYVRRPMPHWITITSTVGAEQEQERSEGECQS